MWPKLSKKKKGGINYLEVMCSPQPPCCIQDMVKLLGMGSGETQRGKIKAGSPLTPLLGFGSPPAEGFLRQGLKSEAHALDH